MKLIKVDRGWLLVTEDESEVIARISKVYDFEKLKEIGIRIAN